MIEKEILDELKYRIDNGKSIRYTDIKKENPKLLFKIDKRGGIVHWCKKLGLDEETLVKDYGFGKNILPPLTEEDVLNRLIKLKSEGKLTTNRMRTEFNDLRLEYYLKKNFGSVKKALEYYNLKKDLIYVNEEYLLNKIKEYSEANVDMCYTNMIMIDSPLVSNCVKFFKMGWNCLLESLNIEFTSLDKTMSITQGRKFEKVFKEVLEVLNIDYIHNKKFDSECIPDFQLDNNIWLDCKLSSWTSSIPTTINKYKSRCDKLIIVYLRGDYNYLLPYEDEKVEFRNINYYYKSLLNLDRQDLIDKLENIIKY